MKRIVGSRGLVGLVGLIVPITLIVLLTAGASSASVTSTPVTRTFSFIGKPGSKTVTVVNIDSLLINARCNPAGSPIMFAFSSATNADLFGRVFDGAGRLHIVRNSSFTKKGNGVLLSPASNDFDTTGMALFETAAGKVVTVNYSVDNSTTLGKLNVCTVFGSFIAT